MIPLFFPKEEQQVLDFFSRIFHSLLRLPLHCLSVCEMQWDLQAFMSILCSEKSFASMLQVHYLRNGFLQCVLRSGKPSNCLEILVNVEDGRFSVLAERTHYADGL